MKKIFLSCALLGLMLVSFDASAIQVDARGLRICTAIDSGTLLCTAGTFYSTASGLEYASSEPCDWGTPCEVWDPDGLSSISDAVGVNWSCCITLDSGETSPTNDFEHWLPFNGGGWVDADVKGPIGDTGDLCPSSDWAFQGRDDFGDEGGPWDYGTSPDVRVARCIGAATAGGGRVEAAVEYWMDVF